LVLKVVSEAPIAKAILCNMNASRIREPLHTPWPAGLPM
jgi:hypothetical protein